MNPSTNNRMISVAGYTGFQPEKQFKIPEPSPYRNIQGTKSHIPGYRGYLPAVKAENTIGQSFTRISAHSLNGRIP
jgi:hypothetical protein